jgi:hypothetical protein
VKSESSQVAGKGDRNSFPLLPNPLPVLSFCRLFAFVPSRLHHTYHLVYTIEILPLYLEKLLLLASRRRRSCRSRPEQPRQRRSAQLQALLIARWYRARTLSAAAPATRRFLVSSPLDPMRCRPLSALDVLPRLDVRVSRRSNLVDARYRGTLCTVGDHMATHKVATTCQGVCDRI